jgi:uncharacterized protein (TIGR02145 family)
MKTKSLYFCVVLMTVMAIAACDDSSSGAGPDPVAEVSSSSGDDAISSSSVTDKGTSSGGSSVSSSDFFSSSSKTETVKSSSSALLESSSSVSIADQKIPCDMPEHGIYHIGDEEFVCKDGFLVPYVPPSSSSAKVLPFKEKFKIDSVFNEEKTYGTFEDPRDGQIYRTIVIKTKSATSPEFEVFAQNLNYGSQVNLGASVFDDNKVEKFCYDDDPWYCDNYFGGLYSWSETFGLPRACDSVWTGTTSNCPDPIATGIDSDFDWDYLQIQGVCPDGWHVMNENEWRAMIRGEVSAYRSISLASEGVNSNGFSALFGGGGYNDQKGCRYDHVGEYGRYWLPKENSDQVAFEIFLDKSEWNIARLGKVYGLSVRCVKDYSSLLIN